MQTRLLTVHLFFKDSRKFRFYATKMAFVSLHLYSLCIYDAHLFFGVPLLRFKETWHAMGVNQCFFRMHQALTLGCVNACSLQMQCSYNRCNMGPVYQAIITMSFRKWSLLPSYNQGLNRICIQVVVCLVLSGLILPIVLLHIKTCVCVCV